MTRLAFVDTETTGLDPDRHEIWEVGLIVREDDGAEHEHSWQLPVDLGRADPMALNIGRFHDRRARGDDVDLANFAAEFVRWTHGAHLVGAVVSFDADRLWRLLRRLGQCPMWHYHLIDVEAFAAGWIMGSGPAIEVGRPPWSSADLSKTVGVDPDLFDRHTALGDARWAKAIYDAVMGS